MLRVLYLALYILKLACGPCVVLDVRSQIQADSLNDGQVVSEYNTANLDTTMKTCVKT